VRFTVVRPTRFPMLSSSSRNSTWLTCLGGIPESVAIATICIVLEFARLTSCRIISPAALMLNILETKTGRSFTWFGTVTPNKTEYLLGSRSDQFQFDSIASIPVEGLYSADHQTKPPVILCSGPGGCDRKIRHEKFVLRIPEEWIPIVDIQHGDVHESRSILEKKFVSDRSLTKPIMEKLYIFKVSSIRVPLTSTHFHEETLTHLRPNVFRLGICVRTHISYFHTFTRSMRINLCR